MTEPDKPRTGSCYVWTVSCFLFICIVAGGTLLALYMTQPADSPDTSYAVGGVVLVCLPWFFWFLTFCYRLISRACGFRMVCWGAPFGADGSFRAEGGAGGGGCTNTGGSGGDSNPNAVSTGNSTNGGRRVHFGDATVVGEQNDGNDPSSSSRSSSHSHESEMPLKLSMAS